MLLGNFVCFIRWQSMGEGLPHINSFNDVSELPAEISFSDSRIADFNYSRTKMWVNICH